MGCHALACSVNVHNIVFSIDIVVDVVYTQSMFVDFATDEIVVHDLLCMRTKRAFGTRLDAGSARNGNSCELIACRQHIPR